MIVSRITAAMLLLALAACGQKGPLYLPDTTQGEVVTRPTQTDAGASNSPATPDSPQQSTSPAPEVSAPETSAPAEPTDEDKKKNGTTPPK